MSDKRRGLGRGIGALIPTAPPRPADEPTGPPTRPVDVFFPAGPGGRTTDANRRDEVASGSGDGSDGAGSPVSRETSRPDQPAGRRPQKGGASTRQPGATAGDAGTTSDSVSRETELETHPGVSEGVAGPSVDGPPVDGLLAVPGAVFAELPVGSIRPNPRQPRQVFEQDAMAELVHSIREIGVLQPVVVRPLEAPEADGTSYELIMGERR